MTAPARVSCPVCGGDAPPHDTVDFNKSCQEARAKFLPESGVSVCYHLCEACGFCFAPEFQRWSHRDFAERIYNAAYAEVDPDFMLARPQVNAGNVERLFGKARDSIRHLDYGGGAGLLTTTLARAGWNSLSCDPFTERADVGATGKFDLVTAFEVFEHSPDVTRLLRELVELMADESLLLFSTMLSDGQILKHRRLAWWYASPRNGHISLFSRQSLTLALDKAGLQLHSFSPGYHVAFRHLPSWASHLVPTLPASGPAGHPGTAANPGG